MKSEEEFRAYWEGALVWSDSELTDDEKIAKARLWFGLEFRCRHAARNGTHQLICLTDGQLCVPDILSNLMRYCEHFDQMPSNLSQVFKAQSSDPQVTITQEHKESCSLKATVSSEGIGECDHDDG